MTVNGQPPETYTFKKPILNINYNMHFEEQRARMFAGISIADYDALPGTRDWITADSPLSKCDVVILYRMDNFVRNAPQDAQIRESERKAKSKNHGW